MKASKSKGGGRKGRNPEPPSDDDDISYGLSDESELDIEVQEKTARGKYADSGDSEVEVFGVGYGDSSDDEEKQGGELSDSDIEGKEEVDDDLPDTRAWGKKRKSFYSTDYVDQDYGGYNEKDVEAAEQEEEEARAIQKRLVEQLDDADFSLDMFNKKPAQKEGEVQEIIKTDLRKMTKREKLALLQKESPEFFGLLDQFKTNMTELQDKLEPILTLIKDGKIPESPADKYIRTKYNLLLNYCTNITFYLLLKAKRISVQSHPVVRRLYQYNQLLKQLKPVDKVMEQQIDSILGKIALEQEIVPNANEVHNTKKPKKKKLKILSHVDEETEKRKQEEAEISNEEAEVEEPKLKRIRFADDISENENKEENEEEEESKKRSVTYQILRNKGLTPRRKKENRNPRVKHRNKFRKATVRRKGQVREPRKELKKYGGEISGIKIGVVKSIKLK